MVVETSIVSYGVAIREEVSPLEPEDIKLAFTTTKNLIIGILILLSLVTTGSMLGPVTMVVPAKSPLLKALWRAESNLIYSILLTMILY